MGGNLVLKLLGEWGAQAPPQVKAGIGVSPAMDLAASADALHDRANRIYEWRFMRGLKKRIQRKAALYPGRYDTRYLQGLGSLREFDDQITARYCGFRDAQDYYTRAASAQVLDRIAVPTLILHAEDDPFIRVLPDTRDKLLQNPHITYLETAAWRTLRLSRRAQRIRWPLGRAPGHRLRATIERGESVAAPAWAQIADGRRLVGRTRRRRCSAGVSLVVARRFAALRRFAAPPGTPDRTFPRRRSTPSSANFCAPSTSPHSPWLTAKCDVWLDDELGEAEAIYDAKLKLCSYVDLVARDEAARFSFERHETVGEDRRRAQLVERRCAAGGVRVHRAALLVSHGSQFFASGRRCRNTGRTESCSGFLRDVLSVRIRRRRGPGASPLGGGTPARYCRACRIGAMICDNDAGRPVLRSSATMGP